MLEVEVQLSPKSEYSKVNGRCHEYEYRRELRIGDRGGSEPRKSANMAIDEKSEKWG